MSQTEPDALEPDTKDWTWVLDQACPDCGYDATTVDVGSLGERVRANAALWQAALRAPEPARRRVASAWSVLEYACHVRDVNIVFGRRVRLVLDEEDPLFENWDQDAAARDGNYPGADPVAVGGAIAASAAQVAAAYDAVPADSADWQRPGRRDNGSVFTLASLGRYHLHDLVHHAWDVHREATIGGYETAAEDYRGATRSMPPSVAEDIEALARALPTGARVLEIGSGGGRDALALEEAGLSVRRTDVTAAFVELLRQEGHRADLVDPLVADLDDPDRPGTPYDAVWANACLLHVARADLPVVLDRLATATRDGGWFRLSVKEGDGEGWSTHGAVGAPRLFVYWREQPLRAVLGAAGWLVRTVRRREDARGQGWLEVTATRAVGGA